MEFCEYENYSPVICIQCGFDKLESIIGTCNIICKNCQCEIELRIKQ